MSNEEGNCGGEGGEGEGVHGHLCLVSMEDEHHTHGSGMLGDVQAGAKIELDCPVDESEHLCSKCPVGMHLLGINHLIVADVCHPAAHGLADSGLRADDERKDEREAGDELPKLVFSIEGDLVDDLGAASHVSIGEAFASALFS